MAETEKRPTENTNGGGITRREFMLGSGTALVAGGVASWLIGTTVQSGPKAPEVPDNPAVFTDNGGQPALRELVNSMPTSAGYLVHDSTKCAFCQTCMMACSLAHEGKENISLSRIQIDANALGRYPDDLVMNVCRQCVTPVCVEICPVDACYIDTANGNVRVIDQEKCNGCRKCLDACPQQPHRTIWNPETKKATKCDLCLNTPYWGEKGGPAGKQACVELCPMNAIKLVTEAPPQSDSVGYEVDLRSKNYEGLVTKTNTTVWWQSAPAK